MTKRIISLLLAVLLLAAVPGMTGRAYADGAYFNYQIKATDSLETICTSHGLSYNDACKSALAKMNDSITKNADGTMTLTAKVGDTIKVPASDADASKIVAGETLKATIEPAAATTTTTTTTTTTATGNTQTYTVKNGDTVIGICNALKLDFAKCKAAIMKLNGWYSDYFFLTLKTGDKIKLPATTADAAAIVASTATATATATATTTAPAAATTTAAAAALTGNDAIIAYMVPYVVKAGETIYGICVENGIDFSRYFNLIMQASGIVYATNLRAGNVIYIPSTKTTTGAMSIVAHVVKAGETTIGICQDLGIVYNDRVNMIMALNPGKNLSSIHAGEIMYFPAGAVAAAANTGTATANTGTATANTGTASANTGTTTANAGYGGGYTPAAAKNATAPAAVKAKEGVMYYLKEITIVKDDTVYALVKAAGFDYTTYYADVLLSVNQLASFNNLREGDKLLMLSSAAAGAKYAVTGIKVKTGDTVIGMCNAAGINYSDNITLIEKLNPGVNFNNLKTGDIVVLPCKP